MASNRRGQDTIFIATYAEQPDSYTMERNQAGDSTCSCSCRDYRLSVHTVTFFTINLCQRRHKDEEQGAERR